jgi:hypothetical protein
MSQQEFAPEPEFNEQASGNGEDEVYYPQHPYYWSVKPENEGVPRDEPPSSYVESTLQQGYKAQDAAENVKQDTYGANADGQQSSDRGSTRQQNAPNGDAFGQAYGPFGSYNSNYGGYSRGVPPYAQTTGYSRMQRRSPFRVLFLVLLFFLLLKPILIVAGLLLAAIGALVGGVLLFVLLMAFFVFGMSMFRMALRPGSRRGGRYWYRRGSWW